MRLEINEDRLARDFYFVTNKSATELGCTRLSYSIEDLEVRRFLTDELNKINAEVRVDSVGNIRAKYNPDNLTTKSLLIGSHIDTVPNGGKYDGLTGVLASLEVLRTLHENDIQLRHPVELVIFAEEEGSNFGVTMVGSKYMTRKLPLDDLKNLYNQENVSAYEYIQSKGFVFKPEQDLYVDGEGEFAMIELHVEQGGILDKKNISLGVVESIAGMNSFLVKVKGISNHAGTTPMSYRKDSLKVAAEMIYKMSNLVSDCETAVLTVGKIETYPNASNVIAGETVFSIDIRDVVQDNIDTISKKAMELCTEISTKNDLETEINLIGSSEAVHMDKSLVNLIERQANKHKLSNIRMNSGAVHDNAILNRIIPTAMIFLPSIGGISHSPYEDTKYVDIVAGANLLLYTVKELVS